MLHKISRRSVPMAVRFGLPLAAIALVAAACGSSGGGGSAGGAGGGGGNGSGNGGSAASSAPGGGSGSGTGGSGGSGGTNAGGAGATGGSGGGLPINKGKATIGSKTGTNGAFITDQNGRTLYIFEDDSASASACTGTCAATWPPLITTSKAGVKGIAENTELGAITRQDGSQQVTYAGHPLYYFAGDTKAGQANGEGAMGKWFELAPSGLPVMPGA